MLGLGKPRNSWICPSCRVTGAMLLPLVSKKLTKDNNAFNLHPKMLGIQAAMF